MDLGAPLQVEGIADASWDIKSVYGTTVTAFGAAVSIRVKKVVTTASSFENETSASLKCSEDIESARDTMVDLGYPPETPAFLGTDNKANMLVANETGAATRARHALRRYMVLQDRVRRGVAKLGYVPDEENPADYLTKFVPASKLERSIAYLTNSVNAVRPGHEH